jgi:ribosome biogenesis GTPase / thiamine phosphate phosphatase
VQIAAPSFLPWTARCALQKVECTTLLSKSKKKIRANFRKNRAERARSDQWTQRFSTPDEEAEDQIQRDERISGKGELGRKRTVIGDVADSEGTGLTVHLEIDQSACRSGRVLSVHGLTSTVATEDGGRFRCTTRRLLKTLSSDQRHVVAAGDRVWIRLSGPDEGVIERIEPRYSVLSRESRRRQHILVTNVDQVVIVASAAEPTLKPNLIDRFIITAHQAGLRPLLAINKVDLVDMANLMPLVGVYSQLGYSVLLVSAATGMGIDRLRREFSGKASVVAGQSGVGKSSLLNAVDPRLRLAVRAVSTQNQKGRHTTTTAQLLPMAEGGYVVDTPGIRQFQPWDIIPAEVAGYFRDLRPFVHLCRYPNCTHVHESDCAVKDAVADGRLDARRYESYCNLFLGDAA